MIIGKFNKITVQIYLNFNKRAKMSYFFLRLGSNNCFHETIFDVNKFW